MYKKRDRRTDARTQRWMDGRQTDFGTKLIYSFSLKKKEGITSDVFLRYNVGKMYASPYETQMLILRT